MTEQDTRQSTDGAADTSTTSDPGPTATATESTAGSQASSSGSGGSEGSDDRVRAAEQRADAAEEKARAAEERADAAEAQTQQFRAQKSSQQPAGGDAPAQRREHKEPRRSIDVTELVWKSANVLATVVRIAGLVFAAILVIYIALTFVGTNPQNDFAQFIRAFADTIVLAFRDLFQFSDPTYAVVVNYGLAAIFWVLAGQFLSRALRFLAARLA